MTKLFEPTDEQWCRMVDLGMERPVALADGDVSKPFIYSREHGFIPTANGYHNAAMATLYAWSKGFNSYLAMRHLYDRVPYALADLWMEEVAGAAFLSGVSRRIEVWNTAKLTPAERRKFSGARSIDPTL